MRRASSSILSKITSQTSRRSCCSVFSRDFISDSTSLPHSESSSLLSPTHYKSCNKTHGLLLFKNKFPQFQNNPCRNIDTLAEKSPHISSRQRKNKQKEVIDEEFESAVTTDELLKSFEAMESAFDKDDVKLGLACLKVGQYLDDEGDKPEKTLEYANRAYNIFEKTEKVSLQVAMALQLMGSACYNLERFTDSLAYLNRANRILGVLESDGYAADDICPVLHAVQLGLASTLNAMGRREEALVNHKKSLELKHKLLEPDSKELGAANREVADAYNAVLNFKEAMPYCLKALEIHKALGDNSVEVAHDRRLLGVIYTGLGEHQKALEQNELSRKVLESWGLKSDLTRAEIDAANIQIAMGKYEEAINSLRGVIQHTEKDGKTRASVFISMANALCSQEKFADSKRCLEIAASILEKKENEIPLEVAEPYAEIAMIYETLNEFETAISMYKRSIAILGTLPQEQHSEASISARLGWLLMLTGKVPQALQYLETAVETLKACFGPKHFSVGYIYNNMGAAYMELNRPESAAQMFALAKEVMDVALGPNHADTINAYENLSKAYSEMGSYGLAMEFQQKALEAWESHGNSAREEIREAYRLLEQIKKKAHGSPPPEFDPAKSLPILRGTRCREFDLSKI